MSLWRQVTHGLRGLVRPAAADRDVDDELEHYLDEATEAHRARGLSPDAARHAALVELGSATTVRQEVRSSGWESGPAAVAADVRYAVRALGRTPVFAVVAILVIAVGAGAVTTIFSALNAIVLRPLPGTSAGDRLISIDRRRPDADDGISASYAYFDHLRRTTRTLDEVAAWSKASFAIASAGEGVAVYGNLVSGNYFSLLGVRPALGRFFAPDEDRTPLTHPVMVISHAFWTNHLGADSTVVGAQVTVNGAPYTVLGVAPPEFHGVFTPVMVDAWVPLMMQPSIRPRRDLDQALWLWTFGRLGDGVSEDAAARELEALTAQFIESGSEPAGLARYTAVRVAPLTGLPADARAMAMGFVGLFLGAAVLVLLIASVNVASMLSARAVRRRREMAVRAALGAGRGRLVGQLLTEILVLFLAGGVGGLLLALQATAAIERVRIPADVPLALEVSPDLRVLGFALALSLATGLLSGIGPALRSTRADLNTCLRDGTGTVGGRRRLGSDALIAGQLALSLVLLVTAGLFLRALNRGANADPGFDTSGVMTATFNTEAWGYDDQRGHSFYRSVRERVEAAPGVVSVSFTNNMPLAFATANGRIELRPGEPSADGRPAGEPIQLSYVDAGFFGTLRLPMRRGRPIGGEDDERAPRVAVVNETLARRFWPETGAIGQTFRYLDETVTVVGVAADAKYGSLTEVTPAFAYFPMAQRWLNGQVLLVRGLSQAAAAEAIRDAVLAFDPLLPPPVVTSLEQATSIVLLPQRIAAAVAGSLGGVGLLLAAVGLYGLMSYRTGQRTREIGLRVALGAGRNQVLHLVLREGMTLTVVGVGGGLILAAIATRVLAGFLLNVSPLDPIAFGTMAVLFVGVAWLASYLPARRAASADPMVALRVD